MRGGGVGERVFVFEPRRAEDARYAIVYCMGLIVGEGSFSGSRTEPCVAVGLHVSDPQPLEDLRSVLGGRIFGPYTHEGRVFKRWHLRGSDLLEALPYFEAWLPPSRKREQYLAWRERWHAYFARREKAHVSRATLELIRLAGRFAALS